MVQEKKHIDYMEDLFKNKVKFSLSENQERVEFYFILDDINAENFVGSLRDNFKQLFTKILGKKYVKKRENVIQYLENKMDCLNNILDKIAKFGKAILKNN